MMIKPLSSLFALTLLVGSVVAAPPANDNFSNAQVLDNGAEVTGTLVNATREPGDYDFGGSGYVPPTAWYEWTPATSGVTHLSVVFQSAQRNGLQAFAGDSLASGKFITDDGEDSYLYVVAGHTYHVSFDGASQSGFTIAQATDSSLPANTLYIPPLSNDFASNAAVLPAQASVSFVVYTFDASFEPGEYALLDSVGARYSKGGDGGVWMDWTAPVTGTATYAAQNIPGKSVILLAADGPLAQLNVVAGSSTGVCSFNCVQGTLYHLYLLNQSSDGASASISTIAASGGGGGGGGGGSSAIATQKGVFAGSVGTDGFITVSLLGTGHFTGTLMLEGVKYALHGAFKSDGNYAAQIGRPSFILSLHLDLTQSQAKVGDYILSGSANGQNFTVSHATYTARDLAAESGRYTVLLEPASHGATVPPGAGFATATVSRSGGIHLAGKFADGEPFAAAGPLVGDTNGRNFGIGTTLLYSHLVTKGTKGLGLGSLAFATTAGGDFSGILRWVKPTQSKGLYPAMLDTMLNVTGARYQFARGDSVLPGFVSGTMELSDSASLTTPLDKNVTLTSSNSLVVTDKADDKLTVVIHPATGLFTGSVIYPGETKRTPFSGALLQKTTRGAGYFLSATRSGNLTLRQ